MSKNAQNVVITPGTGDISFKDPTVSSTTTSTTTTSSSSTSDTSSGTVVIKNIGSGYGLYASKDGNIFDFKTLLAGNGVILTSDDKTVTINFLGADGFLSTSGGSLSGTLDLVYQNDSTPLISISDSSDSILSNFYYKDNNGNPGLFYSLDEGGTDTEIFNITKNSSTFTVPLFGISPSIDDNSNQIPTTSWVKSIIANEDASINSQLVTINGKLDTLTSDIESLSSTVSSNSSAINSLDTQVGTNTSDIATIKSEITGLTGSYLPLDFTSNQTIQIHSYSLSMINSSSDTNQTGITMGIDMDTSSAYIDYTNNTGNEYDVRLITSGGVYGTNGLGTINITAKNFYISPVDDSDNSNQVSTTKYVQDNLANYLPIDTYNTDIANYLTKAEAVAGYVPLSNVAYNFVVGSGTDTNNYYYDSTHLNITTSGYTLGYGYTTHSGGSNITSLENVNSNGITLGYGYSASGSSSSYNSYIGVSSNALSLDIGRSVDSNGNVSSTTHIELTNTSLDIKTPLITVETLPTSDPGVSGALWNDRGFVVVSGGDTDVRANRTANIVSFATTYPNANEVISVFISDYAYYIPSNFTGSIAGCEQAPQNDYILYLEQNGTEVATITISSTDGSGTFTSSSGSNITIAIGDILKIIANATPDNQLVDLVINLMLYGQ